MNVLVIGYGRVGREVVRLLSAGPHDFRIIERDRAPIEADLPLLGARVVLGDALDVDVLRQAGIQTAEVVFALTPDENTNLAIAQLAGKIFLVPRVIALAYDPSRRDDFRQAGAEVLLLTVASAEFLIAQLAAPAGTPGAEARPAWQDAYFTPVDAPPPAPTPNARSRGYVIIAGGGKVGYHLGKALLREGHEITLIERRPEMRLKLARQLAAPVVAGDASVPGVLEQVGAARADVPVAVTNHDHENLLACQVAKSHFQVPRTMARTKDPKFEAIFTQLGVDMVISSTAIITQAIANALPFSRLKRILEMPRGGPRLGEFQVQPGSPAAGRAVRDLGLPASVNLVAIVRNGEMLLPRGETVLGQQDEVMALYRAEEETGLSQFFTAPAGGPP